MTLREIYNQMTREIHQHYNMVEVVKQDVNFSEEDAEDFIKKYSYEDKYNLEGRIFLLSDANTYNVNENDAKQILQENVYSGDSYRMEEKLKIVNSRFCRIITGTNRLSSFDDKEYETRRNNVEMHEIKNSDLIMNTLISERSKYLQLRCYIYDAFQKYLSIKLNKDKAAFVLTNTEIPESLELSIKPEALEFLDKSANDKMVSDGVKAYTAIISELIAGESKVLFIDEPEAFLHPPLARKIGRIIGDLAREQNKQVFVSTHSSDFLMGCIEVNVPSNLIRFTYENNIGSTKIIDSEKLQNLMKKPILRSTNFLDGIFYRKVIVTEGDSDRSFYQEVNYRMLSPASHQGIEDCLFLNAQNKQTVGDIVEPLRKIGIPAAAILDLDMIKERGGDFTKYLKSVNIPQSSITGLQGFKTSIFEKFKDLEE